MSALRVVIVDDEPLALDRMMALLGEADGVELLAAASSGSDALQSIRQLRPDLAILDVEMPKLDGFDIVEALLHHRAEFDSEPPLFCFVTAYPQFAPQAFDQGAVDFLCKPVRLPRLKQAIERAKAGVEGREAVARLRDLSTQLDDLRKRRSHGEDRSIWVPSRGEMVRLAVSVLEWVKAEGEYVRLHAGANSFLLRSSLSSFCNELANDGIVQVHRSYAVNRAHLKSIRSSRQGMRVALDDGTDVPVGRHFRKIVQALASKDGPRAASSSSPGNSG
jgi:DNA-binding LytR/AlgR family response regulator